MQRRWLDAASRTVVSRYGHGSRQRALEPLQGQGIMAGWRGLELTKLSETLRRHPGVGITRRRAQARQRRNAFVVATGRPAGRRLLPHQPHSCWHASGDQPGASHAGGVA